MLVIEADFLLGSLVASSREDRPEWPPHPARLFYALACAHFESAGDASERAALEWLEQTPPVVHADREFHGRQFTYYVPVGDKPEERQPKHAHLVVPRVPAASFAWTADPAPGAAEALRGLCARVASLGDSSSFVRLSLADSARSLGATWTPRGSTPRGMDMRVPFPGLLNELMKAHELYAARGVRGWLPCAHVWYDISPDESTAPADPLQTPIAGEFEDLWLFRRTDGPALPAISAASAADALRRAVLAQWPDPHAIPEEVSGHDPSGAKSRHPHVAYLVVPAAGHPHSSGHLVGVGAAIPAGLTPQTKKALWDALSRITRLSLRPGPWTLEPVYGADTPDIPLSLSASRWTRPSRLWASVTPVVLPAHPHDGPFGTDAEEAVRRACELSDLPRPSQLALSPVSFVPGAPTAREFPPYAKAASAPRVHVLLEFPHPVRGPILIGRGRYTGLGLCLPVRLVPS
jgi:CRISPR-associated protein Csb2